MNKKFIITIFFMIFLISSTTYFSSTINELDNIEKQDTDINWTNDPEINRNITNNIIFLDEDQNEDEDNMEDNNDGTVPGLEITVSSFSGWSNLRNEIKIYSNGCVTYEIIFPYPSPLNTKKNGTITQERIESILQVFKDNNFFLLNDSYVGTLMDSLFRIISYNDDYINKTVSDCQQGAPVEFYNIFYECQKITEELWPS